VLPEHPEVLLVEADRVGDGQCTAVVVVDDAVEVADLAEAVAAELEAVGHHPDAVLAHVEHVLAVMVGRGVAVGDEHLRQGSPIDDRTRLALVRVADRIDDQALARVEPDPEVPLLPADLVPADVEAGAFGLSDVERLQVLAHAGRKVGDVVRV